MNVPGGAGLWTPLGAPQPQLQTPATNVFRWATVVTASPLAIQLDGDTQPLGIVPDSLVGRTLRVGERVWTQLYGRRVVVFGAGGPGPDLSLAVAPDSDAGFPVAASAVSVETVLDRFTIAAVPYARKILMAATCYTTVSVAATQVNLILYSNSTPFGYGRENVAATGPNGSQMIAVSGKTTLPANTSVVLETRISRQTGTGTITTSISAGLFNTNLQLIRSSVT